MIEAVSFDLDDTLIEERDWMLSGYLAVAWELRRDECVVDPAVLIAMMTAAYHRDPGRVFDQLSLDLDVLDADRTAWVKRCVNAYRHHVPVLPSAISRDRS